MANMSRWKPDAPNRLVLAALELYRERGFEQTTVAEIAQRAGLTERTFFRHFADKREVLFAGSSNLEATLIRTIAAAPESSAPIAATLAGFEALGVNLFTEERQGYARRRQAVIAANPELMERELGKFEVLSAAVAAVLSQRGLGDLTARLTAEAGVVVFKIAFERWVADDEQRDFAKLIRITGDELRVVTSEFNGEPLHVDTAASPTLSSAPPRQG